MDENYLEVTKKYTKFLMVMLLLLCCGWSVNAQSVDKLEQAENGRLPNGILDPVTWTTGNVNAQKAHYTTGMTIPYRLGFTGLIPGVTYRVELGYDTKHGGKHAIDFLTSYDRSTFHGTFGHGDGELIQPWTAFWQANPGELRYELPVPAAHPVAATGTNQPYDEFVNVRDVEVHGGAEMTIYNGTIVGMAYIGGGIAGAQTEDRLQVDFQVNAGQNRILLAWGGHIASADQWGEGMSAENINGSPYHMRIAFCPTLDGVTIGGCGNKEVQLSATAVIAPTSPVCSVDDVTLDCFGDLGELSVEWVDGEGPFDVELYNNANPGNPIHINTYSGVTSPYTIPNVPAGSYMVRVVDTNDNSSDCFAVITQPEELVCEITGSENVSCFEGSNGSATVEASGGTAPYSYLWSDGQTTATATGLSAGTYTVTITDDKGCETECEVEITEPEELVCEITDSKNVSCFEGEDGEATVEASGGTAPYSYLWSDGQTTATATGLSAGTYTVTITDDKGCETECEVEITEPEELVCEITDSKNVSCFEGEDGEATVEASGGTAPYSYLWSDGQETATATGLSAGTYTVTITDANGCETECEVEITEPEELVCEITDSKNVSCFEGEDGEATVEASGGTAPYSYLWSDGQETATATGLSAGTYTVTITDDKGCETECEVEITEPEELVCEITGSENVSCFEGSNGSATVEASGGTAPYSYLWSDGQTTATATGLSAGTYTVTITDDKGCETECEVEITEPTELTCNAEEDSQASCDGTVGGSATVTPSGGTPEYSYLWSDGQTTATATNLAPGVHSVTVTDANGCTTECQVEITRTPEYFVCETAFAKGDAATCFLPDFDRWGWTNLISESEVAYVMPLWSGAGQCDTEKGTHVGNAIVTYSGGTVSVEYVMFEGFVLKEAHVYVGTAPYPSITKGKTTTQTVAPGQYNYNSGSLDDVSGLTGIVFDGLDGSDVYVIVHGVACEAVCMWDAPESLAVGFYQNLAPAKGKKSAQINIQTDVETSALTAYPNPFSNNVRFEFTSATGGKVSISLFNVQGSKVAEVFNEEVVQGQPYSVEYNGSSLPSGIYYYRLMDNDKTLTGKIIKQ